MIKTTKMLKDELKEFSNYSAKIARMVEEGKLFPIIKGLYETERKCDGKYLAGSIFGPSYLSFDYMLSYYGLIPEAVYVYTSATTMKNKHKKYENCFGTFVYRDVPVSVFHLGVELKCEGEYCYYVAVVEKALCDKLYTLKPIANQSDLEEILFSDLRIDENEFDKLSVDDVRILSEHYKSNNVKLLYNYIKRRLK